MVINKEDLLTLHHLELSQEQLAPPWYWTGRYTTWNHPGIAGIPITGLNRSSLILDRTLHHLESPRNSWYPHLQV